MEIERWTFWSCTLIGEIVIPNPSIRAIKYWAFVACEGLASVTLGDGLDEVGECSFCNFVSLEEIIKPNNFMAIIKDGAFYQCLGLMVVTLC